MTTSIKVLFTIAAIAAISIPFMLQRPPVALPKKQTALVNARPTGNDARVAKTEEDADKPHYRPAPVSRQVQETVDAILRRHKGMTKQQLQRSAELNKLMNRFIAVLGNPEMQVKMEQRIAAIPPMKGSQQGTLKMDFDMLDDAHGRAWLEAAVSDDPQRIEDWILNTLDDAIFEFAFDPEMERTSNGVSLQPGSPAKSGASADPNQND
ncbi:MAG: hypothetical protein K9N47_29505 [Prosthecobacter sp.]|uniref:hypothetical protein n=1 Tax=Prosthecobacter sp. TaxID=1965333 RepID=UPI00262D148E|nr:hypothetical protein [Prosthecobacter sp.]MCF7790292.1 hypothetical protein [Prosthecobacter sp.]